MDDFQRRFPRTVAMVESRMAAQNIKESVQHSHQHGQHKITPTKCANRDDAKCNDPTWCAKCGNYSPA